MTLPPVRGNPGLRATAARVVEEALLSRRPADALLARAGARLDDRDRRLLAELVYGTLRWLRRLDHVLAAAAGRPIDRIDPALRCPLRIGALQLLALERIPPHAAVSEAVEEAKRLGGRGAASFANAVLRAIARRPEWRAWPVEERDPRRRLAIEASHPDELVERWWERFGEERTRAIVAANNGERQMHLLAFADRGGREALANRLRREGVETRPSATSACGLVVVAGAPLATAAYGDGDFYVQDEASQAAALVPPPRAGERVLDAAAAPGGKGLALLASEPSARVVFADRSLARLGRVRANLRRLGRRAAIAAADATSPPWRAAFDRVVLDAPCTGTGTLRRHPELRWRFRAEELARLAAESLHLLTALAPAVASGGCLVLVTCSIEREENEEVTARFLAAEERFRPAGDPWRLLPVDGHDGFSVAVLRRAE